jgi:hypothetical protein
MLDGSTPRSASDLWKFFRMYFVAHDIMSRTTSESWPGEEMPQLWHESEDLEEVPRICYFLIAALLTHLPVRYVDGLLTWPSDLDQHDLDTCICKRKGCFQRLSYVEMSSLPSDDHRY